MKIRIHWSFWLFVIICYLFGFAWQFAMFTLALLVHELGHYLVARFRGYLTLKLIITPLGGQINGFSGEMPPEDEFAIAAAGPLANFIMAIICSAFLWWSPEIHWLLNMAIVANLVQGAFNLIPAYPLDGGRILYSIVKDKKVVTTVSKILSVLLIPLCLVSIDALITCIFLFITINWQGKEEVYISKILAKKSGTKIKEVYVTSNTTLKDCVKKISANYYTKFVGDNFVIYENQLKEYIEKFGTCDKLETCLKN